MTHEPISKQEQTDQPTGSGRAIDILGALRRHWMKGLAVFFIVTLRMSRTMSSGFMALAYCLLQPGVTELYGEPLADEDIAESARVTFRALDKEERGA